MKKQGKKPKQQKSAKHRGTPSRAQLVKTNDAKDSLIAIARTTAAKTAVSQYVASTPAKAHAPAYSRTAANTTPLYAFDDRMAMSMLLLPFLIVAFGIGTSQVWRNQPVYVPVVHNIPARPVIAEPVARPPTQIALNPPSITAVPPPAVPTVSTRIEGPPTIALPMSGWPVVVAHFPSVSSQSTPIQPETSQPWPVVTEVAVSTPDDIRTSTSFDTIPATGPAVVSNLVQAPADIVAPAKPDILEVVAMLVPEPVAPASPPLITAPVQQPAAPENSCVREVEVKRTPAFFLGDAAVGSGAIDALDYGRAVAAAAREQLDDFTVYTDKYQTLKYPMGDLPAFYGVCTDVIVRAYRQLGVDLQQQVHESKLGGGDTNIDHRRVTTLQKFFAKYGDELPITEFGEDYMPGDIVSYYRPQNAHSRTHIAIVSDVVGPSGQWMIIHNRGWGPQIEDGLFVDQITGHYRYSGVKRPASSVPIASAKSPKSVVQNASVPSPVKKVKRAAVSQSQGYSQAKTGLIKPSKQQSQF